MTPLVIGFLIGVNMGFSPNERCSQCGKEFPKGRRADHKCLLEDFMEFKAKALRRDLENEIGSGVIGPYLTLRQRKRLAFHEWCIENGRF